MTQKMIGSAFALALGCAVGLSAQTTAPTDAVNANRDDDSKGKVVTVVGCVQQQAGANDDEFILAGIQPAGSEGAMSGDAVGTSGSATTGASGTSGSPTPESTTSGTSSSTGSETSATSPSSPSATPPASTEAGAGTAGMTMQHDAAGPAHSSYELTGDREDDLKNLAGRRIEITGTVEENEAHDSVSTSMSDPHAGTSETTGATGTSGSMGAGVGAGDQPGQARSRALPRLKITSFREVSGDCAAVQQ